MLFTARRLTKRYAAGVPGCSAVARVLDGVDLDLAPGDVVGVTGDRAAGKTTLVRCVAGLARPDAGALRWAAGAERCAVTALGPAAHPAESVQDVVARAAAQDAVVPERLHDALKQLALDSLARRSLVSLTTDERARLAIALALGIPHPLLLLDGTLDALAAASRAMVRIVLAQHAAAGGAVLATGRDAQSVSALTARCHRLQGGRLWSLAPATPEAYPGATRVAEPPGAPMIR